MDDENRVKLHFAGQVIAVPRGTNLRKALLAADVSPHNGQASWFNCKGFGTCGTCAVAVTGQLSPPTRRERWRLSFPPHSADAGLRLACQSRLDGDVTVTKFPGFWGQKVDASPLR